MKQHLSYLALIVGLWKYSIAEKEEINFKNHETIALLFGDSNMGNCMYPSVTYNTEDPGSIADISRFIALTGYRADCIPTYA